MNKIQPQTVWIVPNPIDNTMVEKSIFRFYDMNYTIMNEVKILISWENGMDYKTVSFNNKRNKFYFSDSEKKILRNQNCEKYFGV
ncbi:hypothetical protein [Chryseobacterium sp. RU37D]|uniref:hypothetical protein n=1 Tax=Chryseobacterium sp. RU37D TaxID=1907397 RepID=UPI00117C896E|nr:hypothetical protein [Chryseobacterium sp. RU37D]